MRSYLKFVEELVCVLVNDATLTKQAGRETVDAPERGVAGAASLTGGGLVSEVQRFKFDDLVGKLIFKRKPVFEVRLKMDENRSL